MTDQASRAKRRPRDANQAAKRVVDIATGNVEHAIRTKKVRVKDPAAVALGRKGGLKGGRARAAKLTPEERQAVARRAASARWNKRDDG